MGKNKKLSASNPQIISSRVSLASSSSSSFASHRFLGELAWRFNWWEVAVFRSRCLFWIYDFVLESVIDIFLKVLLGALNMSQSPSRSRRFRGSERASYRDAPYPRDRRVNRNDFLCNKCKRPGHFARDCPNMTVCNNCGLPGHIAAECNSTTTCWNCKEPGHLASQCPNDPVCHMCGKMGHLARDCSNPSLPSHDARLCNNCYKPGHIAVACTNEKACNNCRKSGHLARDCPNDPVCNICNISGHVARHCAKSGLGSDMGGGPFRDIICRNCGQTGHVSRECVSIVICSNCGGRGHQAYECPSALMYDRGVRRY